MHTTIPALHVGQGAHQVGLTVFPVWVDAPRIGSLDWDPASLRIAEREDGATVDTLEAENLAARPLVALEGDLLEGGWQNRMLARSTVLGPRQRRALPALCVEQGRWGGNADHTAGGRRASLLVRFGGSTLADEQIDRQAGVWRRIESIEQRLGRSETGSFTHQLDRQSIRPPQLIDGQRGVIIGIGGRIMGLELFCSGSGLRSRYAGIVQSAAVDARLADPVATSAERARAFARALQGRPLLGGTIGDPEDAGPRWFSLRRDDDRVAVTGLGSRIAGLHRIGAGVHLTALDRAHPLLAGV